LLDLKQLQNDFDSVAKALAKRNLDISQLETLRDLALTLKTQRQQFEEARAEQNTKSKLFPEFKKAGKDTTELKAQLDLLKEEIALKEKSVALIEEDLEKFALTIPNPPHESAPEGIDEDENIELKKILIPPTFDFEPKDHVELAENLGWASFENGAKLAKSRFVTLHKDGAKLERALINYMLDFNEQRGFEVTSVPFIVNEDTMRGTGQLPKFEEDLFEVSSGEERRLFLIPTAEVPLTNIYADEIIPIEKLPIKMTAHSPCFRKEAGSAGRDTRGMIRQHQFHKVELVAITKPEESMALLDEMVACASDMLSSLGLAHRLLLLCSGDMGFSAAKTIDIEVWIPSQNRYREISSISNCWDFQARRAKIRYKDEKSNKLVHTLNGSSLAVGRTLVAIMENFQNSDGGIQIPQVLKKYL
jgi:seryl-tRNA synthetase